MCATPTMPRWWAGSSAAPTTPSRSRRPPERRRQAPTGAPPATPAPCFSHDTLLSPCGRGRGPRLRRGKVRGLASTRAVATGPLTLSHAFGVGPSLSRKGRGLPLAPIDADRPGAAHEHVKQPAADRDILEEIGVLRLILLGRRGPEGMAEDGGDDGEHHQRRGDKAGPEAQDERRAAEELD